MRLKDYPQPIRQIAVRDVGHEKPTQLYTNEMDASASESLDRYTRLMLIENMIADAVEFFHMDALSAAVPLRIDLDAQLIPMARTLYRRLASLFRKFALAPPRRRPARNTFRSRSVAAPTTCTCAQSAMAIP